MRKRIATRCYHSLRNPRGFVLITATWICIALAAVVLVLAREMMVESLTARQQLDQAKADAAELGMEQFVRSVLEQEYATPGYKDTIDWELRRVGDSYCWVITHNVDDDTQYAFGLTDEASKVDLTTATPDMLMMLPNMDEASAYNIANWANLDVDNPITAADGTTGASDTDYEQYNYHIKASPFESVEELRLVIGGGPSGFVDDYLLYGADLNHNSVLEPNELSQADTNESAATSMLGIMPFITVNGLRATMLPLASTAASTTTASPTAGASSSSSGSSGGYNGGLNDLNSDGTPITIADINATSNTVLTAVLTQYLPTQEAQIVAAMRSTAAAGGRGGRGGAGGGAAATTKKYKNVWDWATQMETAGLLTADTFAQVYPYLICTTQTTATATTTTQVAGGISGAAATTPTPPTGPVGRINIMTAPLAVLECIPGFEEADAQTIIDYREGTLMGQDPSQVSNIAWLLDQIDPQKLVQAGYYITGSSSVYSADIVTVSFDGRAFKRVKIVVDVSTGTPQMLYRRDLTSAGWPLPPDYRDKIKAVYRGDSGASLDRLGPSPTVSSSAILGVK